MTLSDLEWLRKIFNHTKHRAPSLRHLSFLSIPKGCPQQLKVSVVLPVYGYMHTYTLAWSLTKVVAKVITLTMLNSRLVWYVYCSFWLAFGVLNSRNASMATDKWCPVRIIIIWKYITTYKVINSHKLYFDIKFCVLHTHLFLSSHYMLIVIIFQLVYCKKETNSSRHNKSRPAVWILDQFVQIKSIGTSLESFLIHSGSFTTSAYSCHLFTVTFWPWTLRTLTLTCDFDMQTRLRFFSNLRNYQATINQMHHICTCSW